MNSTVDLGEPLTAILRQLDGSPDHAARELLVLELYRRGAVSGGGAAEVLGMSRLEFLRHASRLGIAVITYMGDGFDEVADEEHPV